MGYGDSESAYDGWLATLDRRYLIEYAPFPTATFVLMPDYLNISAIPIS